MWEKISGWLSSKNETEQVEEPSICYEKKLSDVKKIKRAELLAKTLSKWNEDKRNFDDVQQLDEC